MKHRRLFVVGLLIADLHRSPSRRISRKLRCYLDSVVRSGPGCVPVCLALVFL